MPYSINHIHLKSADPPTSAAWWASAFNLTIESDTTRPAFGDRFIVCTSEGGLNVMISGPRSGETLGPADASAHLGLEHFGFESASLEADVARLTGLGAELAEGPMEAAPGVRICFLRTPDDIRVELIERDR